MAKHVSKHTADMLERARRRYPRLAPVIEENILSLVELRQAHAERRSFEDKCADWITSFTGTMGFVYMHLIWFAFWIFLNSGVLHIRPFDPFPFGLLTMIVSLEAIFLSTFVLISQNRLSREADEREELDLQINLLAEHETTRILMLTRAMAAKMGLKEAHDPELEELIQDVSPELIVEQIEKIGEEGPPQ